MSVNVASMPRCLMPAKVRMSGDSPSARFGGNQDDEDLEVGDERDNHPEDFDQMLGVWSRG